MKTQNSTRHNCGWFLTAIGLMLITTATVHANYQSTVLGDNPLAYYALNPAVDGTSTAPDLTGNGNNGSAFNIGIAAGPSPYITNAASFGAGLNASVDLSMGSNPGLLNFSGPITMEAWVQSTNTTQGPADIIGKGYDSAQTYDELVLRANSGVNYFGGSYNNVNGGGGASGSQQTTNWTYLVSTYDGTNWNLYVNSKLVGQGSDAVGAINFSDPWRIGTGSADGTSRYFNGNISEVALYTNALTPSQVLNHFYMGEVNSSPSNSAPIIITQPQPQSAYFGGTATFSFGAASALPTTNIWLKNNVQMPGKTNATLTLTGVSGSDAVNYSVVVGNSHGTTTSVSVSLTLLASGNSLKWTSASNGVWDTDITTNWINQSNSLPAVFNTNDQVLFDDTVGVSNNVTVNGTVSPSVITVNSSTNNFTFSSGTSALISGAGSLVKQGSSLLTIFTPQGLTGPVTISGGAIYAGNNCFKLSYSFTITNNSTLDFGGGTYNTTQPITVSGTGVNGEGALYNSYDDFPAEKFAITLAGDTTFGCTNRWDLNGGSISGPHKITINWNDPSNSLYGQWTGVTIATNVGDIEVAAGSLGILNMGATFGNPAGNFIVDTGAAVDFYAGDPGYAKNFDVKTNGSIQLLAGTTGFNGNVTLENGGNFNAFSSSSGNYTVSGPVTLNGVAHILVGESNLFFTNVISGTGGFVFDAYNHEILLGASNTYTGPTVIGGALTLGLTNNGSISHSSLIWLGGATIDVSGRNDNTLALTSGQTLGGIGIISGTLVVPAGATISPAGTNITLGLTEGSSRTGIINANNNVTLNGTTILKLNGSGTNDEVQAGLGITYGGTLHLVNISGSPYAAGNSFLIFSAATYAGSFGNNFNPTTPGAGLVWDTSQLYSSGILGVKAAPSQPTITSTKASGGNLIFSGTGGTTNGTYYVLTSTNLATPLTNWTTNSTSTFDGAGAFSVTNAISPTVPKQFYIIQQ
jgi:fibronectin-binding autotransporter adhesin